MSLRHKAIKGVLWSGVQNWGANLITMTVIVILARSLDKTAFGLVAYSTIIIELLGIVQRQGFAQALIQRADLEPAHLDTAFWTSAIVGMLLSVVLWFGADSVASWLDQPQLRLILRWLSIVVLVDALGTTQLAILRRDLAFKSLAGRSLAATGIGGIVGVSMATAGCGVWSLVGQQIAATVTGTAALWLAVSWRPRFNVSIKHFKDMFSFGVYEMGREVVMFFNRRADDFLIGLFLGMAPLGVYRIGRQLLATMHRLFTQTVSAVALPTFSRLQHDHAQMRQALLTAAGMTSLLAFPAFLGVSILAPELVSGLFGDKWAACVPIVEILSIGGLVHTIVFFNHPVIVACGKPSWVLMATLCNALLGAVLFTVATHWGIVAVAAARALRNYIYAPVPLILVRKLINLDIRAYLRGLLAPLVSSIVMVTAVWMLKSTLSATMNVYAVIGISVATGFIVFLLSMRWLSPKQLEQLQEYARIAVGRGNPQVSKS